MHRTILGLLPLAIALTACNTGKVEGGDDGDGGDTTPATCPNMVVETGDLDWDGIALGETRSYNIVVQNDCAGDGDLSVSATISGDTAFTGSLAPTTLGPGELATFDLTFTAEDYLPHSATLDIMGSDEDNSTVSVELLAQAQTDADGDGQDAEAAGGTDCDDTDPDVYQRDEETARDLVDDDCDGLVDEDFIGIGDVYVNEVMADPVAVGDGYGEWFEIRNASGDTVDLRGWTITGDDDDGFTIDGSLLVDAGGVVVFGVSGDLGFNGGVDVDYQYSRDDLALSDTDDNLFLYAGDRAIFDMAWNLDWPISAGSSLTLDPDFGFDDGITLPDKWCAAKLTYGDGDKGTPGSANELCTSVDHDGDGYSIDDGDCADADPTLSPGADELWDGIDNNCDGETDIAGTDDATSWVAGLDGNYLTGEDALASGDVDADGTPELIVGALSAGSSYYSNGRVVAIDGTGWQDWGDDWEDLAYLTVDGSGTYNRLAYLSQAMGDQDGDGTVDLVIGGSDAYSGSAYGDSYAVTLFFGSGSLTGDQDPEDADTLFEGTYNYSYYLRILSNIDVDGDGLDEVVYGNWSATRDRDNYAGVVSVVAGDSTSEPLLDLADDADLRFWGTESYAMLGHSLGGGDVDGDGYDELYVGAPGYSTYYGPSEGNVYRVEGGTSTLGGEGSVGLVADTVISGESTGDQLGYRAAPQVADFDGDGEMDLALGAPGTNAVYVVHDAKTWTGNQSVGAADAVISGAAQDEFGIALAAGDVDGDGLSDLAVGAPDTNNYAYASYYADEPGEVYLFSGRELAGLVDADDAGYRMQGTGNTGFGWALTMADFDGDDADELVVGDPGYNSNKGRAWVFNP